ncbi:MAG TPA: energy transducer TonB [Longimicrobium sp.]|nr:energy transducer TonB [Longimicrobium sp.]
MLRISTRAWLAAAALLASAPIHAQAPAPAAQNGATATTASTTAASRDSAQVELRQRFAADVLTAAQAGGATAAGLVVLAADPATGRTELKLARATVSEAALAPVVERVRAELKAFAAAGPLLWHVRLDPAPMPTGAAARPVIDNPREVRALVNRFVAQNFREIFQGRRGLRVDLQLVVSREGEVAYARVLRSSGNPAVDQEALRIAPTMRFQPARVGTQPVDRQINFPLYFVVGEA